MTSRHLVASVCKLLPINNFRNYSIRLNLQAPPELSLFVPFRSTQTKVLKCWKCGVEKQKINDLFCNKCNIIQEPYEQNNYFKILGVEESFDVDQNALRTKYRNLQNLLHPDKFSNRSDEEKIMSERYSSLINKAYNNLQAPLSRAVHMLNLKGVVVEEDQKVTDFGFLNDILELNEEVEAAKTNEELVQLNRKNKKMLENLIKEVSNCFQNNRIESATQSVIKMKYFNSISLFINSILREKGIVD